MLRILLYCLEFQMLKYFALIMAAFIHVIMKKQKIIKLQKCLSIIEMHCWEDCWKIKVFYDKKIIEGLKLWQTEKRSLQTSKTINLYEIFIFSCYAFL